MRYLFASPIQKVKPTCHRGLTETQQAHTFLVATIANNPIMAMARAKELVSSNPVVVFSKSFCPYCVRVNKLLDELHVSYKVIELNSESDGSEVQSALASFTGQRTVPNVFIAGKHIGGCDETQNMHSQGRLVPLLTQAGALTSKSNT